jgi:hypothetical protein
LVSRKMTKLKVKMWPGWITFLTQIVQLNIF